MKSAPSEQLELELESQNPRCSAAWKRKLYITIFVGGAIAILCTFIWIIWRENALLAFNFSAHEKISENIEVEDTIDEILFKDHFLDNLSKEWGGNLETLLLNEDKPDGISDKLFVADFESENAPVEDNALSNKAETNEAEDLSDVKIVKRQKGDYSNM